MAFFDDFTAALKQKWLQYFDVNHGWMTLQMEVDNVKTPDGGRRPPSYLILGVLNALEPKLAQLMLPFAKLNPDADAIIDVLELNFDPDIASGKRPPGKVATPAKPAPPPVVEAEEPDDAFAGMGMEEDEDMAVSDDDDAFAGMAMVDDDFGTEIAEEETEEEEDAFAGIAMDDFDTSTDEESSEDEDSLADMGDMSLDSWGEESAEDESSEESLADLGDMSFEGLGDDSTDSEDEDAFGDMSFEELGDVDLNAEEQEEDQWK